MTGAQVAERFSGRKAGRAKWIARCPAHSPDRNPSLNIWEGKKAVLVRCVSMGCDVPAILEAVGLRYSDLFYESRVRVDDAAYRALQRQRRAEEAKAYRKRIREWIAFFRENGYTQQQYDDDVAVACAAAGIDKAPWPDLLRVSMERITAASIGGIR